MPGPDSSASRTHQHLIPATAQALQVRGYGHAHPILAPAYIHAMHGDIAGVHPPLQDSWNTTAHNSLGSPKLSPMVMIARWFRSMSPTLLDNITAR